MKRVIVGILLVLGVGVFALPAYAAGLVDINTADSTTLQTLNGIGPSKAQAIIDYRDTNGPFATIEEIKNVSGIGDATYSNIKDYITVGGSTDVQSGGQSDSDTTESSAQSSDSSSSPASAENSLKIIGASVVVAGAEVEYRAEGASRAASYKWNFGDGAVGEGEKIDHTFAYAGKYSVELSITESKEKKEVRLTVEAVALPISLVAGTDGALGLQNSSKRDVDVGGWSLVQGDTSFVIPEGTMVLPGETLRFVQSVSGIESPLLATLHFPGGKVAATAQLAVVKEESTPAKSVATHSVSVSTPAPEAPLEAPEQQSLLAAVGEAGIPLWGYGAALAVLVVLGGAATFFFNPLAPAMAKRPEDEFEIDG